MHHSINGSFAIRQGDWKLELCPTPAAGAPAPGDHGRPPGCPRSSSTTSPETPANVTISRTSTPRWSPGSRASSRSTSPTAAARRAGPEERRQGGAAQAGQAREITRRPIPRPQSRPPHDLSLVRLLWTEEFHAEDAEDRRARREEKIMNSLLFLPILVFPAFSYPFTSRGWQAYKMASSQEHTPKVRRSITRIGAVRPRRFSRPALSTTQASPDMTRPR